MKFVFFFLSLLLLNVSLSFQNQDKTDTVNENEEKGYQIIKGYNYNSNKTGYTAEIEKEPVLCTTNLIPGLNMMKRGVDLNKFDFFLFGDQSKNGVNRFADSVFEFTCNNKNKWQHNKINHTYDFPDEIQSLRDLSTGKLNTKFSLKKSLIKTKEELAIQAGLESDYAGFGFSTSETYKQAKECLTEKKSFMALVSAYNF